MLIGRKLSALPPKYRAPVAIRECVNNAAADLAESFIGEESPHYSWFDQAALFSLFDRNVLSRQEFKEIADAYDRADKMDGRFVKNGSGRDALGDLYRCGLIGTTKAKQFSSGLAQNFESVFDARGNAKRRCAEPADSDNYLVHPVLGSLLRRNYSRFGHSIDSINIIAPGADWAPKNEFRFVLQADVCGFSKIINDVTIKEAFPRIFDDIRTDAKGGIEFYEPVGGDGFALADRSGYLLVLAARRIATAMRASIFNAELRFGLDYGVVRFQEKRPGGDLQLGPDNAVQRSARLQAASGPGHILMVPHVRDILMQLEVNWPFFELGCRLKSGTTF